MPPRVLHPTESPKTPLANSRFPKLWQVTSPTQRFLDAEENKSIGRAEPIDVGRAYVARWMARATEAERRRLTDWTATWTWVPHDLDPDLLRFANDLGIDTWEAELEPIKHELRAGFLDGLKKWRDQHDTGGERCGDDAGAWDSSAAAAPRSPPRSHRRPRQNQRRLSAPPRSPDPRRRRLPPPRLRTPPTVPAPRPRAAVGPASPTEADPPESQHAPSPGAAGSSH